MSKCEYCGSEIDEKNEGHYEIIEYFTNAEEGRFVAGEYATDYEEYGTMCGTCATKLKDKVYHFLKSLGIRERYERKEINKEKVLKALMED